jgi:predicted DCC family thiol-disulfide oxidoreductase YuxK
MTSTIHRAPVQAWHPAPDPPDDDRKSLVILFDGRCGICTRAACWLLARDRHGRVRPIPNQRPGILSRFGLTRDQVDRAVWVIDLADGRRLSAGAAINRTLLELGGLWPWAGRALGLPPLAWAEETAYRWVSAQRGRLARWGIAAACDHPDELCDP